MKKNNKHWANAHSNQNKNKIDTGCCCKECLQTALVKDTKLDLKLIFL